MFTKKELIQHEKYLKLNELGDFALDFDGEYAKRFCVYIWT